MSPHGPTGYNLAKDLIVISDGGDPWGCTVHDAWYVRRAAGGERGCGSRM